MKTEEINQKFYLNNPSLPSATTEFEWTSDMLAGLTKSKKDIIYFAETYFTIVNLDRGKEIIKLYKAQKRVLKSLVKNNRVALLSARQAGKSTLISIFALWYTTFNPDKTVLIVANKEKSATELLSRIRLAYELLPNFLKPAVKEWAKTDVSFVNGSRIFISSTSSSSARGGSINLLIVDECAHIERFKEEEFFKSIMPVISSSKESKIFIISTAKGTANHFYKIYSGAERKENGWKAEKINWTEVPGRDAKWKQSALADLGGDLSAFAQEYENIFIETGETAIDKEIIAEFRREMKEPTILNTPEYKVWEKPDPTQIYVIGADVGDGVGAAASTLQGLNITDLTNIRQAFTYHNKFIDTAHFAKEMFDISCQWGKPPLIIERNAMGGEVLITLNSKPFNYERIVSYNAEKQIEYEKLGVYSSTNSRYEGISNMRYWMNSLRAVELYDVGTIQELETFVKYPNGTWHRMPGEGIFDDRVLGLMWALFALHIPICESLFEILKYDERGKPLKIAKNYYEDDNFYGLNQYRHDWQDNDFVPAFVGQKRSTSDANPELDDLISDGWKLLINQ